MPCVITVTFIALVFFGEIYRTKEYKDEKSLLVTIIAMAISFLIAQERYIVPLTAWSGAVYLVAAVCIAAQVDVKESPVLLPVIVVFLTLVGIDSQRSKGYH